MAETDQAALESAEKTKAATVAVLEELLGVVRGMNAVTLSRLVLATFQGSTWVTFLRFSFSLIEDVASVEPLTPEQQAKLDFFRVVASATRSETK